METRSVTMVLRPMAKKGIRGITVKNHAYLNTKTVDR